MLFLPTFFLASLNRALSGIDIRSANTDFELSCLKVLMCGGEANVVSTLVALNDFFLQCGVEHEVFRPGFGMTETCAGSVYGRDCPSYDVERGLEYASVGTCIPGMKMRIAKDEGTQKFFNREAEVDEVGHLQLSGPIVFKEYFNNPAATEDSFTQDGWFVTGDKGYIDAQGNLNLTGRSKETIIVNGVKYFLHELDAAIEQSVISGVTPSYTIAFPHRPRDSETEKLCVVYLPTYDLDDAKTRTETAEAISNISMLVTSIRPYRIVPLTKVLLPKSSLGKFSRAKIRAAFESGAYRTMEEENNKAIKSYRVSKQEMPSTDVERKISAVLCEMFDLSPDVAWVGSSLFDFGITSIDLITFKLRVEDRLAINQEIPLLMIMKNPTIRGMAEALEWLAEGPRPYDPVVTLQDGGIKTPLWLVHPGNGEVLGYLGLAKYITDRPLYALRARGLEKEEECFHSLAEITEIYYVHVKKTQPTGPYAIIGWSQGSLVAYELARLLEANSDKVVLCGNVDMIPDLRSLYLNDMDMLVLTAYLFDLMSKEQALEHADAIHQRTHKDALSYIFEVTPAKRREELGLDLPKFVKWAALFHSLYSMVREYKASGNVETLDVFYAGESGIVSQDLWMEEIKQWSKCSRTAVGFYECSGAHHSMLSGENLATFQSTLKAVLKAKGI